MPEENKENGKCLSLEAIREKLKKDGKGWRGLDEIAETEGFQELVQREFPRQAAPWTKGFDRRTFLKFMGASVALAGLASCRPQRIEKIVPYVKVPEDVIPGLPMYYATALTLGGYALGAIVESHDGRPTKIEGNEGHPATLGSSSAMMQAMILDLYDPDRSKAVLNAGRPSSLDTFYKTARPTVAEGNVRILTETVTSPTLGALIEEFLSKHPGSEWHQFEPLNRDNEFEASNAVFGRPLQPLYNFTNADVIVSLDSDFLMEGPGAIRYARQFADGRRVRRDSPRMNRLYAVSVSPTNTSAAADSRLRAKASEVETIALMIATGVGAGGAHGSLSSEAQTFVNAVVEDLMAHRGAGAVVAGPYATVATHAAVFAINQALGNVGQTVNYVPSVEVRAENHSDSLAKLITDIEAGRVSSLIILGGNPVYSSAGGSRFADALAKVPFSVRLGMHDDETSALCTWHIPMAHELEAWGDARAFDGTASIVQPLIEPLYEGISAIELLDGILARRRNGYDIVRSQWERSGMYGNIPVEPAVGDSFEKRWKQALNDGFIAHTAGATTSPAASMSAIVGLASRTGAGLEVNFRPDPTLYDGRFANNAWMQECPRPITRVVWDTVIQISPAMAEELGWNPVKTMYFGAESEDMYGSEGFHGGELGVPIYRLEVDGLSVTGPLWVVPGHADGCVTVTLGGGRKRGGEVLKNVGFDANEARATNATWTAFGAKLTATGEHMTVACTQLHHTMDHRALVQTATVTDFEHDPDHVKAHAHGPQEEMSMYPPRKWDGNAWGMSIDNSVCIGCNACVIACQAENNIPVVGKDDVLRGREMHWIRIDRYYHGTSLDNPDTLQMPVPCMQCEKAPCEVVCPVAATVHGVEGLNDMVYNRCVGTRYCANNCPYKVRRFNFYQFADNARNPMPSPEDAPVLKLLSNPDVTVRGRGVMEKCTYCVQRINEARKTAKKANRAVEDGEVVTACEAACPTKAIVFGNINDPESRVAKLKAEPHNYSLLPEINTRPRTTYLVRISNPSPALAGPSEAGEGH